MFLIGSHVGFFSFELGVFIRLIYGPVSFSFTFVLIQALVISLYLVIGIFNASAFIQYSIILNLRWSKQEIGQNHFILLQFQMDPESQRQDCYQVSCRNYFSASAFSDCWIFFGDLSFSIPKHYLFLSDVSRICSHAYQGGFRNIFWRSKCDFKSILWIKALNFHSSFFDVHFDCFSDDIHLFQETLFQEDHRKNSNTKKVTWLSTTTQEYPS